MCRFMQAVCVKAFGPGAHEFSKGATLLSIPEAMLEQADDSHVYKGAVRSTKELQDHHMDNTTDAPSLVKHVSV